MINRERTIRDLESIGAWHTHHYAPFHYECAETIHNALELLKEQKPVVLCRDCEYWNAGTCLNDNVSRQIEHCGCYPDFATDSNWYCAEGKRRQDND